MLPEEKVAELERLAGAARAALAGVHGSVAAPGGPEVRAAVIGLTRAVSEVAGLRGAELAVTDWILTRRPITTVALYWGLPAGRRVALPDGRVGHLEAADPDGLSDRFDPVWLERWVRLDDGERVPHQIDDLQLVDRSWRRLEYIVTTETDHHR
jgi:hypothetical protein